MNIEKFRGTDTDLGRFIEFSDKLPDIANVEFIDWDNMCAIKISNDFAGMDNDMAIYNFYDNGEYRVVIEPTDEDRRMAYKMAIAKDFNYMSLIQVFKFWRKHTCMRGLLAWIG